MDKLRYEKKNNRVFINKDQYFEGVAEIIWQYHIGGYQVCDKWLKDRKDRALTLNDIKHYCKMVTAIKITLEIQKSIDETFRKMEQFL